MNTDLLATMKRIRTVAHYALEQEVVPHTEVAHSLAYIIEEADKAITRQEHATLFGEELCHNGWPLSSHVCDCQ